MMNSKVKKLALAVSVALGGMSMVPSAQAVSVAQDNLGQALIFPYYTVQKGWRRCSASRTPATRSWPSRCASANPTTRVTCWTSTSFCRRTMSGRAGLLKPRSGPAIFSEDNTCTIGTITAAGVPFPSPTSYVGAAADGGPTTVARMNEGYVEMIMMGSADPAVLPTTGTLARGAIHAANGTPPGCAALVNAFQSVGSLTQLRSEFGAYGASSANGSVGNPLMGTFSLVNGAEGYSASGKPVTLANFSDVVPAGSAFMTLQLSAADAGNFFDSWHEPSLDAALTPGAKLTVIDTPLLGGTPGTPGAGGGSSAVTFALAHTNVINEWTRRTNPAAGWTTATDWVITFPTKNFYVDNQPGNEFAGRNTGRGNAGYIAWSYRL